MDGGAFVQHGFGGVGVVIRDHSGSFLAAQAVRMDGVMDVNLLEAKAVSMGDGLCFGTWFLYNHH